MKYKLNENLEDEISQLENANSKVSDAYDLLSEVKGMFDDGAWSGKAKDITKELCEACDLYHKDILEKLKYQVDGLKTLNDEATTYMESGKIPSDWR